MTLTQVMGEAFTLAQKASIDPEWVYTFIADMMPAQP